MFDAPMNAPWPPLDSLLACSTRRKTHHLRFDSKLALSLLRQHYHGSHIFGAGRLHETLWRDFRLLRRPVERLFFEVMFGAGQNFWDWQDCMDPFALSRSQYAVREGADEFWMIVGIPQQHNQCRLRCSLVVQETEFVHAIRSRIALVRTQLPGAAVLEKEGASSK